jgi:hypothetical protein
LTPCPLPAEFSTGDTHQNTFSNTEKSARRRERKICYWTLEQIMRSKTEERREEIVLSGET